jgi:aminoglycoside phosphotransferase (APT) family kinase protein
MQISANTVALTESELSGFESLNNYLQINHPSLGNILHITRYSGGYSNLTYHLQTTTGEYVLRRPPVGANIKSAHDMSREYRVLSLLKPHYAKVPSPLLYCAEPDIIGAPFYIMESMQGIILRAHSAPKMNIDAATFHELSANLVNNLIELHSLDIDATELTQLGKPEGYVQRQVEGWIKRYYTAETDNIDSINEIIAWMQNNQPRMQPAAFLHNDYKYDNVILHPADLTQIIGVLDWEMSTVGDPLMDLGAMLAYWFEADEASVFKQYNLTWLPGNFSRKEIVDLYSAKTGRDLGDILFYYVFGLFKNAVIAQQIYHRWKQGHSKDARFGALLPMIQLLGETAAAAVASGKI